MKICILHKKIHYLYDNIFSKVFTLLKKQCKMIKI